MRTIFLLCLGLLTVGITYGQTDYENNGYNLKNYCEPGNCLYFKFNNDMNYPVGSTEVEWTMTNTEIAVKRAGSYLVTGDLAIIGKDMGAKLNFEVHFYDADDQLIFKKETGIFEFYSEPNRAEPIVFYGEFDSDIAEKVDFMDFIVISSEVLPYYELSSDCYGPCKDHQLNVSIKEFRKS
ncbi:hypothetical protein SAMN04488028_101700 [Reichenbachiella agariperforans]|uniref:Uncharacterized protein n=1 Tax=Reichenbachiella agariperforans TaxID=156994 RepID=A0A1M6KTC9_REIAG|nr:hypothetical protein [Reichenbachiella agariperforans]SHJ62179.1 hypothetical protein SAMN04488028_101700 [Reichenbachiella agariperforans]